MTHYIALLRKSPDSDYSVDFPDFPGCITAGSTLEEARAMAEEALAFHTEEMVKDGEALPEPSPLDAVDTTGAVAFLVPLKEPAERVVRINITLSSGVLARLDAYAESQGYTRSGLIARAAEEMIARRAPAAKAPRKKAKAKPIKRSPRRAA